MTTKKTLTGPQGIKLVIDHADDATPAMVYNRNESASASYDAAVGGGVLAHDRDGDIELTTAQLTWLDTHSDEVEEAFNVARKDNPEYD